MTVKNKTEEPKKEKAEPAAAPNDDLVCIFSCKYQINPVFRNDKNINILW